jgi:splicing factor 3B subunit 3
LISTTTLKPTYNEYLKNNEVALCMTTAKFSKYEADNFLLVGTATDYKLNPSSYSMAYVRSYILSSNNQKLQLLHVTTVDALPLSITPYKGMILAGIGYMVRLYDIGKAQLLKKCEYKHLYMGVNNIKVVHDRIFVTDVSDSFHLLKYKQRENQFIEVADDVLPRWITKCEVLDYGTVIGADKFENLFVCRLGEGEGDDVNENFFSYKFKWEAGYLNGAASKVRFFCL